MTFAVNLCAAGKAKKLPGKKIDLKAPTGFENKKTFCR